MDPPSYGLQMLPNQTLNLSGTRDLALGNRLSLVFRCRFRWVVLAAGRS